MSEEAEAVGAAATAGLAASAIDGAKSRRKRRQASGPCANCGVELTGSYCASCGQPAHLHHALLNMVEEFVRSLVLFDTRAWKTLSMMICRPGTLTYQYIHGKRARYISPLAMFLLCVFAMFAIFAFTGGSQIGVGDKGSGAGALSERLANAEDNLNEASNGVIEFDFAGKDVASEGSIYDQIKAVNESGELRINTGWPALDDQVRHVFENPELAVYKVQNAAYKFAFLLVPISLPLVWLMFMWRRGTTLFGHAVYILYSLSLVSILFITFALLALVPGAPGLLTAPLLVGALVHSYFHLKGGYGLSWFSAAWRLPFQLLFSLVGLIVFILVIIALGVLG